MSGGSYDYLCYKEPEQVVTMLDTVAAMAERLRGLGYAEDAARETEETLLIARQSLFRLGVRIGRLSDVWHAIEWWDSMDSGEDAVKAALLKYRGEDQAVTA